MFDETCKHREAALWTASSGLVHNPTLLYGSDLDPDYAPVIPLYERWHKDLADTKGWESEPDEGRRIKTRFARHYARKVVVEPKSSNFRGRSRSLPPPASSRVLSQIWRDHVVELLVDKQQWRGLIYIALGRH